MVWRGLRGGAVACVLVVGACGGDDAGEQIADAAVEVDAAPDANCTPAFTIFVNRNGGTYTPGADDAAENSSAILSDEATLSAHTPSADDWDWTMDCIRAAWTPYNVLITDQDPGAVPHMEVVVTAEDATAIGFAAGMPSVAPFSCGVIDDAIAFVFVGEIGAGDAKYICWNTLWVTAKIFGLDNVTVCPDVNSLPAGGCTDQEREFLDVDAECGERTTRACQCGGMTQNSHQLLLQRAGAAPCP